MAELGTYIAEKYEILKLVGKGGMSEVYLAMDKNLNKQWAVKEIKKEARDKNNRIVIQSAIAEANMMKQLDHPCLPRVVDILDKSDAIYVVMDYIEGETLSNVLTLEGAQNQEKVVRWAKELCGVLEYLHSQNPPIIYRDMKPANIILQPNGNIKLIDFGIAREFKETNLEDTVNLGTKGYAAPEQFGGNGQTDVRTDIYGLGVTVYYLLTGHNPAEPPYEIYPIRYWNNNLSGGVENIVLKCTQTDPNNRYQSCKELEYALEHYEEEDDEFRRLLRKDLYRFYYIAGAGILFVLTGIICMMLQIYSLNNDYQYNLELAQKSNRYEERIERYIEAISLKPELADAYIGLISAIKEDMVFSIEEEEILRKVLNENLLMLQQEPCYASVAYEIGKLYWYYYDYGSDEIYDNQLTRMKSAIQWFEDACQYGNQTDTFYDTAFVYKEIGIFHRDITLRVMEAEDENIYALYFQNMMSMMAYVEDEDSEIVRLEIYRLVIYSLETYAHKFKQEGITENNVQVLYNDVVLQIANTNITTEKTENLLEEILGRLENTQEAIRGAYSS